MTENLVQLYQTSFRQNHDLPALSDYFKSDRYTYLDFAAQIARLHLLFQQASLQKGDRVALIGRSNVRWCTTYIAAITYGAVIVPILPDFNPNDIVHIINHSESRLLFVGDQFWDAVEQDRVPGIEAAFSLTDLQVIWEPGEERPLTAFQRESDRHFAERYPDGFSKKDITYPRVENDRVVLLNYTSGTTGYSKGVMLTADNLAANVMVARDLHNTATGQHYFVRKGRTLSFLPLAHAYGCALDFLTPLAIGGHITLLGKIPTPKILLEAMQVVRPTAVCCVPLLIEKIYRRQVVPLLAKGPMSLAIKVPLLGAAIRTVIRKRMLDAFGGSVELFMVGGAPINPETEAFLMSIKFPLTVGYGMTECAPLISLSPLNEFKAASCGRILKPLLECRIDSEDPLRIPGEIQVRGAMVMRGYYKNDEATAKVLEADGWLHTGDMGTLDKDGTLYIKGRCKSMILGASGQNIYPEEIEGKLNNMYLVLESLVMEDGTGRLKALVVPDFEQAQAEGVGEAELPAIMTRNLAELNTLVAAYEQVASITVYPTEFEKTPKKSIKRYLYNTELLNR